jgi:hypothetical protein
MLLTTASLAAAKCFWHGSSKTKEPTNSLKKIIIQNWRQTEVWVASRRGACVSIFFFFFVIKKRTSPLGRVTPRTLFVLSKQTHTHVLYVYSFDATIDHQSNSHDELSDQLGFAFTSQQRHVYIATKKRKKSEEKTNSFNLLNTTLSFSSSSSLVVVGRSDKEGIYIIIAVCDSLSMTMFRFECSSSLLSSSSQHKVNF